MTSFCLCLCMPDCQHHEDMDVDMDRDFLLDLREVKVLMEREYAEEHRGWVPYID